MKSPVRALWVPPKKGGDGIKDGDRTFLLNMIELAMIIKKVLPIDFGAKRMCVRQGQCMWNLS